MNGGQGVESNGMFLEETDAAHHAIKRGLATLVDTIRVMQLSGAIDGNSDEEVLLCKEISPLIIQQNAIGLKCVFNSLSIGILGLKRDNIAKIVDSQQRRLAALPGEVDYICILLLNVLLDIRLEDIRGHGPLGSVGIKNFLLQIKAVLAVQIANWPDGLGQNVERSCADCSHLPSRVDAGTSCRQQKQACSLATYQMSLWAL